MMVRADLEALAPSPRRSRAAELAPAREATRDTRGSWIFSEGGGLGRQLRARAASTQRRSAPT